MEKVQKTKVSLYKKTMEVSLIYLNILKWLQFCRLLSSSCICLIETESRISGRGRVKREWFKSSVHMLTSLQPMCRAGRGMGLQNVVTVISGSLTSLLEVYFFLACTLLFTLLLTRAVFSMLGFLSSSYICNFLTTDDYICRQEKMCFRFSWYTETNSESKGTL